MAQPLRNPFGRQLLTKAEIAYALGIKKGTITYWAHRGYLKRYGTRHAARYNWDEVVELMENPPKFKVGRPVGTRTGRHTSWIGQEDRKAISLMDAAIAGLKAQAYSIDRDLRKEVAHRILTETKQVGGDLPAAG